MILLTTATEDLCEFCFIEAQEPEAIVSLVNEPTLERYRSDPKAEIR